MCAVLGPGTVSVDQIDGHVDLALGSRGMSPKYGSSLNEL